MTHKPEPTTAKNALMGRAFRAPDPSGLPVAR
ncbi:MAG: hypothetical protein JWM87_696 [Candidatus Eremiobacteraeota bacterium]|nr:hypothetical protein [Candidatus Eremiobacteraeota bacterium]